MTHARKLNKILNALLYIHKKQLEEQSLDKRLTFSFICNTVTETTDEWEIEFLKQRLLSDGYMKMKDFEDGETPVITSTGICFIQNGAYEQENRKIDGKIKEEILHKYNMINGHLSFQFYHL